MTKELSDREGMLQFLDELIPYVEKAFKRNANRILDGMMDNLASPSPIKRSVYKSLLDSAWTVVIGEMTVLSDYWKLRIPSDEELKTMPYNDITNFFDPMLEEYAALSEKATNTFIERIERGELDL